MLSDTFIVKKDKISCTLHELAWSDLSCLKQLLKIGLGMEIRPPFNDSRDYLSYLVNKQLDIVVLYVVGNATNIWLDHSPCSYVICSVLVSDANDEID